MKIAIIHSLFDVPEISDLVGGAEVTVKQLADELQNKGHEVRAFRILPPHQKINSYSNSGYTVECFPTNRPYWLHDGKKRAFWEKAIWHFLDDFLEPPEGMLQAINRFAPDIVSAHNVVGIGSSIFKKLKNNNISYISFIHDYYYLCPKMTLYNGNRSCKTRCTQCTLTTTNRIKNLNYNEDIVFVSEKIKDIYSPFLKSNCIPHVIYNSVDKCGSATITERPDKVIRFGYLGRVVEEKGIYLLAEEFSKIAGKAELHIGGKITAEAKKRFDKLGCDNIFLHGFVKQEEFLSQIDVLVVPSLWEEPFGRVSIEAQTVGIPVIVSNMGGLPETLLGPDVGWIFDPSKSNSLSDLLHDIVESPAHLKDKVNALADKGWEKFSLINQVDRILEVQNIVLSRKK